jgi:hypothetical protein
VEALGSDRQAGQIGQGMGRHEKPPGSIESKFGTPGDVKQHGVTKERPAFRK